MRILALDTASGLCSAALLLDGELASREAVTTREHARLILPMVQELLAEAGIALNSLDAIAFGRGPGSFTGLRIAASVTQGLAFGADLEVLPVSDLRALALQALALAGPGEPPARVLACMDARMHETYWALFEPADAGLVGDAREQVTAPAALVEAVLPLQATVRSWVGAGRGLEAYALELACVGLLPERLLPRAEPRAREIARLGAVDFKAGRALPAEAAVPVYLRDQVASPPRP
jgi:tRNA threonylcarbamoyladenosine biosynthesis protein TsaB